MKILRIHSLEKGWCEWDHLLLHACFQVLVDFMEKDRPAEFVNWNSDAAHRKAWREIRSLYVWWKEVRPARRDPLDDDSIEQPPPVWEDELPLDAKKFPAFARASEQSCRLQAEWRVEDDRNLRRLIKSATGFGADSSCCACAHRTSRAR